ncbi:Protein TOXD like protein [Verticillium longisporum]|uniref:Protein TOXD like protein n=1 Tax=Verticillium longisporum TaxID=100787 RepID=A0A8I2ZT53_VERLO|nr:Protein TOXD like protein [Verticillium longisporum]
MPANQAVKTITAGNAQVVDVDIPKLPADDYILVKTTAVAINPTDWKHVDLADKMPCENIWVGCDYAGVVEEVGSGVTKAFKKGDRICGPGQGLYQTLKLPLPSSPAEKPFPILIYGGSTAMGISGIQYAKLSGLTVVTTASPHNFDYVKSLGADAVFDYKSPTLVDDIRAYTNGQLRHAWDCQSTNESALLAARCLADEGGHIATLLPVSRSKVAEVNDKIKVELSLYYTIFGEEYTYFGTQPAVKENYEFGKTFWELSRRLLAEGKVKPIRVIKNRGGEGLEGVLVGLKEMKEGKVSAGKLVYTI